MLTATEIALRALGETDAFCKQYDITLLETSSTDRVWLARSMNDGSKRVASVPNPAAAGERASPGQALWLALSLAVQGEKSYAEFTAAAQSVGDGETRRQYDEYKELAATLRWFFKDIELTRSERATRKVEDMQPDERPTEIIDIRGMSRASAHDTIIETRSLVPVTIKQFEFGADGGQLQRIGTFDTDVHTVEIVTSPSNGAAASPLKVQRALAVTFEGQLWPLRREEEALVLVLPGPDVLDQLRKEKTDKRSAAA